MKILAVGAHLDDIEIAAGGVLSKAVDNGHSVKALILSKSGYTNYNGTSTPGTAIFPIDTDGNINIQFYFSKLEEILLQYNLSLDEEKNLAKYYV